MTRDNLPYKEHLMERKGNVLNWSTRIRIFFVDTITGEPLKSGYLTTI